MTDLCVPVPVVPVEVNVKYVITNKELIMPSTGTTGTGTTTNQSCNINLLDGIHCLKCFSQNVSGVESTPVFR